VLIDSQGESKADVCGVKGMGEYMSEVAARLKRAVYVRGGAG
jgi:hypothetical protein